MNRKVNIDRGSIARVRIFVRTLAAPLFAALVVSLPAAAQSFCEPVAGTPLFCPCGNPPSGPGRGCDNSNATGGAALNVSGNPSISNDTLVVTVTGVGNTGPGCSSPTGNVPAVLLQGNVVITGTPFFDGVRCVGGNLKRIEGSASVAGVFTSTVGISATSASLGDVLSSGSIRYYFLYYRDPCPTFACTGGSDLSNASNAYQVTWTP
jgi:hypothetical protein